MASGLGVASAPRAVIHKTQRPSVPHRLVPDELWGAFNALAACVRCPERSVAANASALLTSSRPFEEDLDFKARLSLFTRLCCVILPPAVYWLACATVQGSARPETFFHKLSTSFHAALLSARVNWLHVVWLGVKGAAMVFCSAVASIILRYELLQRQYSKRQHKREDLGDEDSLFKNACGINVHYKRAKPALCETSETSDPSPSRPGARLSRIFSRLRSGNHSGELSNGAKSNSSAVPVVAGISMYHGFGANLWSWRYVQQRLADAAQAVVVAHDMPGFGLTERAPATSAYYLQTNGDIGRELCEGELQNAASERQMNSEQGSATGCTQRPVILVGHSLGAAGVASSFVNNSEGVAGIVLVAPAIIASPFSVSAKLRARTISADDGCHRLREEYEMNPAAESSLASVKMSAAESSWAAREAVAAAFVRIKRCFIPIFFFLLRPVAYIVLRALVRMKQFWVRGLNSCYFDTRKLSDQMLYYYRLPQLMKGWEYGILKFLQARITADERLPATNSAHKHSVQLVTTGNSLLRHFEQRVKETSVPIIIIHGEQDQLVPVSNSVRLAAVLQAPLVKISGCGHMPAEELPDCFVAEICQFLDDNFKPSRAFS